MRYSVVFYVQSLLVAVFILGVPSCKKKKTNDCEDINHPRVEVSVTEIELKQVLREPIGQETCRSEANIPCFIPYKDKDKVKASSLAISFTGKTMPKTLSAVVSPVHNQWFMRSALACGPVPQEFTNQKITSFEVKSNTFFNSNFPASADLSSLLVESYSKKKISIDDINLLKNTFVSFSEEVTSESIHAFTFTFVLDHTDTLSFTTPPIVLVKE